MQTKVQEKLKSLTTQPGVYLFRNSRGNVLYVGKAGNLRNRVQNYFQSPRNLPAKTQILVSKIADLETILVDNEVEALILESNLIKKYKPRYNVNLKDDKSYPYIRITHEPYPRVFVTRRIIKDGSRYLGPYTDVKNLRQIMKTLRKIFPIRSCKYYLDREVVEKHKVKLCLDYHIQRCPGPCEGLISETDYQLMIRQVERFLKGKTRELLDELEEKMQQESGNLNFENAARTRDQIQMIGNYHFIKQKLALSDFEDRDVLALALEDDDGCVVIFKIREGKVIGRQHFYLNGVEEKSVSEVIGQFLQQYYLEADYLPKQILLPENPENQAELLSKWLSDKASHKVELLVPHIGEKKKLIGLCQKNARFLLEELKLQKEKAKGHIAFNVQALQRDLNLKKAPRRIEAFDISNFQGKDAVASMVSFLNGKPYKSDYRHFKIRSKDSPDDFAMMREVVGRRYKRLLAEKKTLPDLILVDGGKGQLSSAVRILEELGLENQLVIGLAKRLEEIYLPGLSDPQNIAKRSSGLKLLQHIRDESHRFAITYHRKLRAKRIMKSPLDDIPGVGPKRKEKLLKTFGSLKRVKAASKADLVEKAHIPKALAQKIKEKLRN